jgi:hypothetical protein
MAKPTPEQTAQALLALAQARMGQSFDMILADEEKFAHLDRASYSKYADWFEGRGYAHLADLESPGCVAQFKTEARTFHAVFASRNGSIVGDYFQLKHQPLAIVKNLFADQPSGERIGFGQLARALRTQHIIAFHSMLDSGEYLITSNAPDAGLFDPAPFVDVHRVPHESKPKRVLAEHIKRLRARLDAEPDCALVPVTHRAALIGLWQHVHDMTRAHREAIGWVTAAELPKLGVAPDQVDQVYAQIQAVLGQSGAMQADGSTAQYNDDAGVPAQANEMPSSTQHEAGSSPTSANAILGVAELAKVALDAGVRQVTVAGSPLHPLLFDETGTMNVLFDDAGQAEPMDLACNAIAHSLPNIHRAALVIDSRITVAGEKKKADAIVVMVCERGLAEGQIWAQCYRPKSFFRKFRTQGVPQLVGTTKDFITMALDEELESVSVMDVQTELVTQAA